ncbi:MAG: FAD-dependent oxidoreductase, partial [Chloroflexota bacterium]|nr:FAD-dependent oxidoreductase [Chloroflexota bacterium]
YFIIPWNGLYLIGTTDVRYEGDLDRVVPSELEVRYLLDEANLAIPAARLEREDVLYAYAGLRPLPYVRQGSESGITRRHIIRDHGPRVEGLISIIGGKLTTYRNLAEQAVNAAGTKLDRSLPASRTAVFPLPGGVQRFGAFASTFQRNRPDWLSEQSASYLLRVYGIRARNVVALAEEAPALCTVVSEQTGAIGAAVVFAFREEAASTLTDAIMRRTMIGYAADAGFDALDRVAGVCQAELGWSDERTQGELTAHQAYMERFLPKTGVRALAGS